MLNYWLGMYLGDGMCRKEYVRQTTGEVAYQLNLIVKKEQVSDLERLLTSEGVRFTIKTHTSSRGEEYYTYWTRNDKVAKFVVQNVGDSENKHFPEIKDEETCWKILSGFIDSDGNIDSDKIHLCNTNKVLIDGIKSYLDYLGIVYTEFEQKTKNKPCFWITIKSTEVPHTKFELMISHKRERYLKLKQRSRGRRVQLGEEWFRANEEVLKKVLPPTTFKRRFSREWWYLDESEIDKVNKYQETGGI